MSAFPQGHLELIPLRATEFTCCSRHRFGARFQSRFGQGFSQILQLAVEAESRREELKGRCGGEEKLNRFIVLLEQAKFFTSVTASV